ncbi:MAG TPA: hypothetical protein VF198_05890 [Vicinamibacterales bacterium]
MAPPFRSQLARARRFPLDLPARVRPIGDASWFQSNTCNVSRTGVLLADDGGTLRLDVGVELVLTLPTGATTRTDVAGVGRVVRRGRQLGHDVIAIAIDLVDFPGDEPGVQGSPT